MKGPPVTPRQHVEAAAEAAVHSGRLDVATELIDTLDTLDADPDFEPSLAAPEGKLNVANARYGNVDQRYWAKSGLNDLEEACDDEGADDGV